MRISDWSSDVCSSDLRLDALAGEGKLVADRLLHLAAVIGRLGQHADRLLVLLGQHPSHAGADLVVIQRAGNPADRILRLHEVAARSEEHTSELQSLMRISYAVFCLKKKTNTSTNT